MKRFLIIALLAACGMAHAQSTPAKKELIGRILAMQQPAIDSIARSLGEQPAAELTRQASPILQARIPADQRDAAAKDIQAYVRKYLEDTVPKIRDQAVKLAPSTVGAVLDAKFSEDELKQLVAIMESPVNRKFLQLGSEMQKALGEALVTESRTLIQANAKTLEQAVAKRLGLEPVPAAAGAAKAPAKPAGK